MQLFEKVNCIVLLPQMVVKLTTVSSPKATNRLPFVYENRLYIHRLQQLFRMIDFAKLGRNLVGDVALEHHFGPL